MTSSMAIIAITTGITILFMISFFVIKLQTYL